jgi:type II secretory pathway predicted ATPase ExeA
MRRWALASKSAVLVLTGPPGIGKTLLLKVFATRLGDRRSYVYISYPDLSLRGLSKWVLQTLGKPAGNDPATALAREAESHRRQGAELLLLIDDASRLPAETARMLAEWTRAERPGLRLVLVAGKRGTEAALMQTFGSGTAHVALEALLTPVETATLVRAELSRTGAGPEIQARFDAATLASLHEASEGVPARLLLEASQHLPRSEDAGLLPKERPDAATIGRQEPASAPPGDKAPLPAPRRGARLRIPTPAVWAALGVAAGIAITLGLETWRSAPTSGVSAPLPALPPVAAPPPLPRAPTRVAPRDESASPVPAQPAPVQTRLDTAPESTQPLPAAPQPRRIVTEGAIAPGSWLAKALRERGVPNAISTLIARELAPLFDFRHSRSGQRFRLVRGADGELLEFDYTISPGESIHLRREGGRYVAHRQAPEPESTSDTPPPSGS